MNFRLTRCLPTLAFGVLLICLGLLMQAAIPSASQHDASENFDAGVLQPRAREARPVRASLSMPYFSFGQSLRPRG